MSTAIAAKPPDAHSEEVWRFDIGYLEDDSPIVRSEEGFAIAKGVATGTGVFPYRDARTGEVVWELRHPDDVFHPDSLASLGGKPTTIEHPPQLLSPDNVAQYQVGSVGNKVNVIPGEDVTWVHNGKSHIVKDGLVEVIFNTHRRDAIERFDAGEKRKLSSGYRCTPVGETGVYNGRPYQRRQKKIRYNHVSHIDNPRLGQAMAIRWDSTETLPEQGIAFQIEAAELTDSAECKQNSSFVHTDNSSSSTADIHQGSGRRMATLTIGRATYDEVPETVVAAVNQQLDRLDALQSELETAQQGRTDAEGRVSELETQLADLTSDRDRQEGRADGLEAELEEVRFELEDLQAQRTDATEAGDDDDEENVLRIDAAELEQRIQAEAQARVDALTEAHDILSAHHQDGVELTAAMAPEAIRRAVVDALTPSNFEISDAEVPGLYKSFQMGMVRSDAVTTERADMLENAVTVSGRYGAAKQNKGGRKDGKGISQHGKQRMDNYKKPMAVTKS